MDPAIRRQLLEPFLHATQVPLSLFRASCQLLLTALADHPSLQDLLLFPTGLSDTEESARVSLQGRGIGCRKHLRC